MTDFEIRLSIAAFVAGVAFRHSWKWLFPLPLPRCLVCGSRELDARVETKPSCKICVTCRACRFYWEEPG